ncbi:Glycerate 2-kinase [Microbacterium sp. MM2322]|uniref:glycerate kinase n=1 Tax=Microbacterium sp. MM2322 TaxID=3157631 RepID=UPI003D80915C
MKVVFALDSFKGSIAAEDAVHAVADGWRRVAPRLRAVSRPMADGGEGTLRAFLAAESEAAEHFVDVDGPRGPVHASWGELPGRVGVVELASSSGIELYAEALRPWDADTSGFGHVIRAALDHGMETLIAGIGSSASTDAGTGLLRALGARFVDGEGEPVPPGARGLRDVVTVDVSHLRPAPRGGVIVLSDVTNPLTGSEGAARVFGAQKGFTGDECRRVDEALGQFAPLLTGALSRARPEASGSGAAGGAGFALSGWGGQLRSGAHAVAELSGLREAIADAAFVITGEGAFDGQSAHGKVPGYVQSLARELGVPVGLIAGRISPGADTSGFTEVVSLTDIAGSGSAARLEPARWLRHAGGALARRACRALELSHGDMGPGRVRP